MTAELFYVGITRADAPLAVRERLHADEPLRRRLLADSRAHAGQCLLLGTCERFEWYAVADADPTAPIVAQWGRAFGLPVRLLERHVRALRGDGVPHHLLRVAAGLESRLIGEPHVLGQVRQAFQEATSTGTVGAALSTLARTAIHAGKRVRRETALGFHPTSAARLAVEHLGRTLPALAGRPVVVLGTGAIAREVLGELRRAAMLEVPGGVGAAAAPATCATVVSRDRSRAVALAAEFAARAATFAELSECLSEAEAVIACTAAPSYVLTGSHLATRRPHPLIAIDLGVPRNIDPALAYRPGVSLTHLEALKPDPARRVADRLRHAHASVGMAPSVGAGKVAGAGVAGWKVSTILAAERIVAEEFARFRVWQRERRAVPAIVSLVRETPQGDARSRQRLHARIMRLKAEAVA